MIEATVAGSLPKPSWLAEPETLWPAWRLDGDALLAEMDGMLGVAAFIGLDIDAVSAPRDVTLAGSLEQAALSVLEALERERERVRTGWFLSSSSVRSRTAPTPSTWSCNQLLRHDTTSSGATYGVLRQAP